MSTRRPIGAPLHAQRAGDGGLDLALGDVERAQGVPIAGVAGEIAGRGGGAVGAHRGQAGGVGGGPGIGAVDVGPAVEQLEQGLGARPRAEAEEHPAPLLAALGQAGVDQDADVARDPGLALPEHLGELADAQLHRAQQHQDPKPGRIREGGENLRGEGHGPGHKDFFICGSSSWRLVAGAGG